MIEFEDIFQACLEKNFPLAAFQFPGEKEFQYTIQLSQAQKIPAIEDVTALTGFIFAPFQENDFCPALIINPDITGKQGIFGIEQLNLIRASKAASIAYRGLTVVHESTQAEYMNNVSILKHKISEGKFRKAILSRVIIHPNTRPVTDIFQMMCRKYQYSFISIVNIPGLGCWIGASPELLFRRQNHQITLVALAGTQARNHESTSAVVWDEKEVIEQKIVTEYLRKLLDDFNIHDYKQSGPETVQAGEVLHIKTVITIPDSSLTEKSGAFLKNLHPTPAVWGQPKTKALEVIKELEGYDREYYSGFLGPVVKNGNLNLYVNLRTMKVLDNKLMIYVGSGITNDSVPEREWEETCMKATTLESILNQH